MALSKREKHLVAGAVAAVAILALYLSVLSPYLERRAELAKQLIDAEITEHKDNQLFARQHHLQPVWEQLQKDGLKVDASQAESQALHALIDWAQRAGVSLSSLKSERPLKEGQFQVISFNATGSGSTAGLARLLWSLETATIPIRVSDLQINSRPEGTDALSVRLSLSTLCKAPQADAAPTPAPSPAADSDGVEK